MATAEQIMLQISQLEGELAALEAAKTQQNVAQITSEVYNFIHCISDNFVEGDYYAPSRLYSKVPGVKNIRWHDEEEKQLLIKITSPAGMLIPNTIVVDEVKYSVVFTYSSKFEERVDY